MLISISAAFSQTIDLIKKGLSTYLWISIFYAALSFLVGLLVSYTTVSAFSTPNFIIGSLYFIPGIFFLIIFSILATIAVTVHSVNIDKGQAVPLNEVLKQSTRIALPFLWISVLSGLLIFGGLFLLVIPGLIFAVWFSQAEFLLIDKGIRGWAALKESKRLIKGHFWGVVLLGLVGVVFYILVTILISIVFGILKLGFLGDLISSFGFIPMTVYAYVIYRSLKQIDSGKSNTPAATQNTVASST